MGFFRPHQPFEIGNLPPLDLSSGPVTVDIGYLGGEAHRRAFAEIFGRVVKDNAALLADCRLAHIDAGRPVHEGPSLPISAHDLVAAPAPLALALYDSRNERIRLDFVGPGRVLSIGVRFDNPEFWLE